MARTGTDRAEEALEGTLIEAIGEADSSVKVKDGTDQAEKALEGTLIEYDAFAPALHDHTRGSRLDAYIRASTP